MEDFKHLFNSHFEDNDRSLTNTLAGFIDHATRLAAALPTTGTLATALGLANGDTKKLAGEAHDAQQALGLSVGTQKQATTQTEATVALAFERLRKNEASLKSDLFIADDAERERLYALLYPGGGLGYYTKAPLGSELADRLGEYLTRTHQQSATLGPNFVNLTDQDLQPVSKARETQVAALATTDDARTDRRDLVVALNEQCDYNYHLLSAHFRTDLRRPANYWNPAYYLRAAPRAATGQVLNRAIRAHQHRQVYDLADYPQFATLTVSLRDGGPATLALVPTATSAAPATTLPLPAGPALTLPLASLPGTGTHLLAYNDTGYVLHLDAQLS